jgi:hypothetical protein
MKGTRRAGLRAVAVLAVLPFSPAAALSASDEPFDLMRLADDGGSPRLLGLGGAFVGLGDDVNATVTNPAALTHLPRTLDTAAAMGRDWTSFLGAASQPHPGFSVGLVLWGQPPRVEPPPGPLTLPAGRLRFQQVAGAMSWRIPYDPLSWISIGAGLEGSWLAVRPPDTLEGSDFALRYRYGLFFDPEARAAPRVGVTYVPATTWTLEHRAEDPGVPPVARITAPGKISAGASWAYDFLETSRLLTTYQQDYVLYSDLLPPSGVARAHDDWDFRLGFELSLPFGDCSAGCGGMVQLRAALTNRAPIPYSLERIEAQSVTGLAPSRTTEWAAGASVALARIGNKGVGGGKIRLDAGYEHRTRTWLLGASFRFPEAYRGDLRRKRRTP